MTVRPGILASLLIGLGALLFLVSYFWSSYSDRRNWTEERAEMWTEASGRLHSLSGPSARAGRPPDPHAQAELEAAQAKFAALNHERDAIIHGSRWWASLLWGSGIFLMLGGLGLYVATVPGASG